MRLDYVFSLTLSDFCAVLLIPLFIVHGVLFPRASEATLITNRVWQMFASYNLRR